MHKDFYLIDWEIVSVTQSHYYLFEILNEGIFIIKNSFLMSE